MHYKIKVVNTAKGREGTEPLWDIPTEYVGWKAPLLEKSQKLSIFYAKFHAKPKWKHSFKTSVPKFNISIIYSSMLYN